MSGYVVRKHFMRDFQGLAKQSRASAVLIVVSFVGQTLAAMALGYWLLSLPLTWGVGVALGLVMLFIATRLRGFNNIVHECSHATFSAHRADNALLGSICASLVLSCFKTYRDEHMTHHQHLGDYDKDMDLQGIRDLRLEEPLSAKTVFRHIMTPLVGLHLPYYLNINLSGRDGIAFWLLKVAIIIAALTFLVLDPKAALVLVWIPFVVMYSAMNYWTDCVDHAGLIESGDELEASRNFLLPKPLQPILFPRSDCYHLVHHLFPQVPSRHFEACHAQLMDHPAYEARNSRPWDPVELPEAERT